jgi:hypothetical protein
MPTLAAASPPTLLSENGCGRATGYAESNKIVRIGDKTHVAWLDSQDENFWVRIKTFDHATSTWSPTYTVGKGYDNHGGPALTHDSNGYLHIVYYPHHHPFRYRKSINPNDASEWTKEVRFGNRCTYPTLVCSADDTLYLTCRESSDQQWRMNLYKKPPNQDWQGPTTLLKGNASSGYTRWQDSLAFSPKGNILHMGFMIYERDPHESGYAIGYMRTQDGGETWEKADGTKIPIPASPSTIDLIDGSSSPQTEPNFRPGSIAVDPKGTPWMIYSQLHEQPFNTWLAHPNENGDWMKQELLPVIRTRWPNRSVQTPGCIAFDQKGTLYLALTTVNSDQKGKAAFWGHPTDEVIALVSDNQGESFEQFQISLPDPQIPNWLPNLQRPTRPTLLKNPPSLLFTQGPRGETNKDILSNKVYWCELSNNISDMKEKNH